MSLTAAYVALLTGVVVWFLLVRKLSAKSWETAAASIPDIATGLAGVAPKRIQTGEEIKIKASKTVGFKPAPVLKESL